MPDRRVFRLGSDVGLVCALIIAQAAPIDEADLMTRLGVQRWTGASLVSALRSLLATGLIVPVTADPTEAPGHVLSKDRRVAFRHPLTVQFTLFDPEVLCWVLSPLARVLRGRLGLVLSLLGLIVQVGMLARGSDGAFSDLSPAIHVVGTGLLLMTAVLHELGHGVVLSAAGGRPLRAGFMLMCLAPAFFCDVSDGFKLGRREQIEVALAGVAVQCQVGALLVPLALFPGLTDLVHHYVAFNLLIALANLIPFLPVDGSFVVRVLTDRPALRTAALAAWRQRLGRQRRADSALAPAPWWLAAFGAISALAPILLTATMLVVAGATLLPGRPMAAQTLIGIGLGVWMVGTWIRSWRGLSSGRRVCPGPLARPEC
jgi:putative peptide zinc metalloprotease protein